METKATERTYQGILLSLINRALEEQPGIGFEKFTQEEQVGVNKSRFADGLLYSSIDKSKRILFELKNVNWDATDEALIKDAMMKAFDKGYNYFVTGTPRQLALFKTFEPNTTIFDRKLKLYTISNVKNNDDILKPYYEALIYPKIKTFLKELSDIVHERKAVVWDTIDRYFVNKLSAYILESSADMYEYMHEKINNNVKLKKDLKEYLRNQDIFNVSLNFDHEDIYKFCQLSNYLLFLKIIFYSYLQRDVPSLKLKPLEIPEDRDRLNRILRERFDDVLKNDYEEIFSPSVIDEFEFTAKYIPVLKRNVEQIRHLNFYELSCDIIGSIYNTLIDNQEQHDRGQHFTNTNEVDIINAFCINANTEKVLDSGCGAGTFLVRAYRFIKYHNASVNHMQLMENLWGVDIAPFPVFLAKMNLCLLDIKTTQNYPIILASDFSDIKSNQISRIHTQIHNRSVTVTKLDSTDFSVVVPQFDACIGNPPYIRQEKIHNKKKWENIAKTEWGMKTINKQSDLYVYYLMHTAAFLKDGGRLGYVISSSWLDSAFGTGLQEYLLNHFKIISIIDNQLKRSFETALINTVILILEKCNDEKQRNANDVKFVRVSGYYEDLISGSSDAERINNATAFVNNINNARETNVYGKCFVIVKNQNELRQESTIDNKYTNGYWGPKYLRSPVIYTKIMSQAKDKLVPLCKYVDVVYGIKTGANEFFYVTDDTHKLKELIDDEYLAHFGVKREKHNVNWREYGWYYSELTERHYILERRYFKPILKSQREANNLEVEINNLRHRVLLCAKTKNELRKYNVKLIKYIEDAETKRYQVNKRETCAARAIPQKGIEWYNLFGSATIGTFIFPAKIGERYRLIDNRKEQVFADKVNYNIIVKDHTYDDVLFAILNSTLFRYLIDLFSRQMVVKVSDVDVNLVEKTLIVKPELLINRMNDLDPAIKSLKAREQLPIFEEVKMQDRIMLDEIIFEELGLDKRDLEELYSEACAFVQGRKEKSESIENVKKKKVLGYDESLALIKERYPEITAYNKLMSKMESKHYIVPNLPAKFPDDVKYGHDNLFKTYSVYFKDGNKQTILKFENIDQLMLFKFLFDEFEYKGLSIDLPIEAATCREVFKVLKSEHKCFFEQIETTLKVSGSKANVESIYRDLIFGK